MSETQTLFISERNQEQEIDTDMKDISSEKQNSDSNNSNTPKKDIERLLKLMDEHELSELEYEDENQKIRLQKEIPADEQPQPVAQPPKNQNIQATKAPGEQSQPKSTTEQESSSEGQDTSTETITSPLVGTFYRAPAPDADPFVEVGEQVTDDKVVCIVEAMKVMNEIKAEMKGEISEVLVEDGESVEFGQPLFKVK